MFKQRWMILGLLGLNPTLTIELGSAVKIRHMLVMRACGSYDIGEAGLLLRKPASVK